MQSVKSVVFLFSACVLVLLAFQSVLYADPQDEPPTAPPSLAEEAERLKTLKKAEFEKLKAQVFGDSTYEDKLKALGAMAGLGTEKAVELLGTLYDNPLAEASQAKERQLIVNLLGEIGSPACAPTVLKAARNPGKDGGIRRAAAKALWKTMGKQALSHLKKLTEDTVEEVRNEAWLELLKVRDMGAMRHIFKELEGKEKLTALQMIKDAHFTEAAKDVAKLAKETDFSKGPNEKILKLKALEVALDLGHKDSAAIAIELIGAISKEQAEVLEVKPPIELLEEYTREGLGSDKKKLQQWWGGKGKDTPLFSSYLDATELKGIGTAFVNVIKEGPKIRTQGFEGTLKIKVVYIEKSPVALASVKPDGSVRVYTRAELELLRVEYVTVDRVISNGTRAFVTFSIGFPRVLLPLEFLLQDKSWHPAESDRDGKKDQ